MKKKLIYLYFDIFLKKNSNGATGIGEVRGKKNFKFL